MDVSRQTINLDRAGPLHAVAFAGTVVIAAIIVASWSSWPTAATALPSPGWEP
jgi:hypothetical protein